VPSPWDVFCVKYVTSGRNRLVVIIASVIVFSCLVVVVCVVVVYCRRRRRRRRPKTDAVDAASENKTQRGGEASGNARVASDLPQSDVNNVVAHVP